MEAALKYLKERRFEEARSLLEAIKPNQKSYTRARILYTQSFLAEGDRKGFHKACRSLTDEFPDSAQAQQLLGVSCTQLFAWEEALTAFRRALALNPADFSTAENLGIALDANGWHRDSYNQLQNLWRTSKRLGRAGYLTLVRNAQLLGDKKTAHKVIRLLQETDPDNAAVMRLDARNAFAHNDNLNGEKLLKRAAKTHPGDADILADYGIFHLSGGNLKKARRFLRHAIAHDPCHAGAHYVLADMGGGHHRAADDDREDRLSMIRAALQRPDIPYIKRAELNFAGGKILDSLRRYEESFGLYDQGNKMIRARLPDDAIEQPTELDDIRKRYDKAFFDRVSPVGGKNGQGLVFLVGMPRSGTTVLEQILSRLDGVSAGGESVEIHRWSQDIGGKPARDFLISSTAEERQQRSDDFMRAYQPLMPPGTWRTNKAMQLFSHLGMIAVLFPGAKIIHCRRNALDTCVSAYFQFFRLYHQQFSFHLKTLGRYYRAYGRLMAHWRAVLPMEILDVDYEDLVRHPGLEGRKIADHCGFTWSDQCLSFEGSDHMVTTASIWQVRQGMNTNSVERWRRYENRLAPLFDGLGDLAPVSSPVNPPV